MRNEKRKNFLTLLAVTCSMLLIMGCSNPFESLKQSAPVEAGYGRVSISFSGGEERTVFPAKVFDNYVYTFTSGGESSELSPDEGVFTLEVGAWRVDVAAYVGEVEPDNLAAIGTANFTVSSGPTTEVTVALDAVVTAGNGTFTYTVQYPSIANAEITLKKLPGLTDSVDLTPDSEETDDGIIVVTKTATNVPAGFYLLTIQVHNGGWHAGISEAVHIYPLLTTEYAVEFDEADLLPTVVDIANIMGITPVIGEAPPTEITETEQYTGTVTWDPNPAIFVANTEYTATITLTVKHGCLLQDVPENFFTVAGADSVSNAAGSGVITAIFTTPYHLTVTNTTEWNDALSTIRSGGNDKKYIIQVTGSVGVGGITFSSNTDNTAGLGTVTGIAVTLMGNGKLYLTDQGYIIIVSTDQTLIIDSDDLILEGLRSGQNGSTQDNNVPAVSVSGTSARLELKNGTISGNNFIGTGVGGVYIGDSGNFTMTGGTVSNNTPNEVSVYGNFTMSGGTICGNNDSGGGVYVGGSFTMSGGTISGHNGTGVIVSNSSSFTMSGGTISDNNSSNNVNYGAGGVSVYGNFTMSGGTISGNSSCGVSVNANSSFTLSGGTICGNNGRGVLSGSTNSSFTMTGGTISGNTTTGNGGGVFTNTLGSCRFTMSGGTISGNTVLSNANNNNNSRGGGVYVEGDFTMLGGTISGNTAQSSKNLIGVTGFYDAAGGGVFVIGGTFRIVNGTIYGSDEGTLSNTVVGHTSSGAAYYNYDGAAERGIFNGTTWNRLGYLSNNDNTVRVVNGVLVEVGIAAIAAPIWREGNDISLATPLVYLPTGQTVTAQGWQISDNGNNGWLNFPPPSTADMFYNGKYLRYYAASSDGETYYSNTVTIRVISLTEWEVTIAMWDSFGNGWDSSAALRINVNGTNLATNARLTSGGGPGYYIFSVSSGDVVQMYWVSGGTYDRECAFAVYYTDDPPSPAFAPSTGTTGGKVLVSKRYSNPSGAVGSGTLMGSFTVP